MPFPELLYYVGPVWPGGLQAYHKYMHVVDNKSPERTQNAGHTPKGM
jgi:hypothetical protein